MNLNQRKTFMNICIDNKADKLIKSKVVISGSKSESNRLLILQQLYPEITIKNLSDSDDTHHMQEALASEKMNINIGHAGTAMRFLTAFFAFQHKIVVLSGSERMHQRPIKILVDALLSLGAEISYEEKEGFPPLKIKGKTGVNDEVAIEGNVSSQYISALLLVAPSLPNGLTINLIGEITSIPYIKMTLELLNEIGVKTEFIHQKIRVYPKKIKIPKTLVVESDWSSASYFYSIVAISKIGSEITLSSFKENSLQGDSSLSEIYKHFGVSTTFNKNSITLKKETKSKIELLELDLNTSPDIAQTVAVTCFVNNISCNLLGLHTLKIKETDRLLALETELKKLGASISVTDNSLHLQSSSKIVKNAQIETYNDHRMAMAFAPVGLKVPITILDAEVVTKSYRNFWKDMQQIGLQITQL